ncbi:MAG: DUF1559 domain-containing protein [Planctomycetaceae bacterium]
MPKPVSPFRRGFTLIELLVVIAIIAILVALLLPAVQSVREAARRSQCQDQLHNIVIGFHNYEGTFKVYPPGWVEGTGIGAPHYGWGTYLMPFVEMKPLYDAINPQGRNLPAANATIGGGTPLNDPIELYACPSDSGGDLNELFGGYTKSNYVPTENICFANSKMAPRNMTDGTSNIIMIGERRYARDPSGRRYAGAIVFGRQANSTASAHFRACTPINTPTATTSNSNAGTGDGNCTRYGQSSGHPGGAHVAMGDGKVTFLSENIENNPAANTCTSWGATTVVYAGFVYQNLYWKDDGNAVSVP